MAFTVTQGSASADREEFPVATTVTHYLGDPVALNTSTGYTVVPTAAANRLFLGWAAELADNSSGADAAIDVRVNTGAQIKQNVPITGTGGAGALQASDLGSTVYVTAVNTYTVVEAANQMKCGILSKIRSTSNGDILWNGLSAITASLQLSADIPTITDNSGGVDPGDDTIAAVTNIALLTDSTGGTPADTIAAITAVGGSGATTAQEGEINDNFASITEELIAQRTANTAILAAIAQLAAKMNNITTALDKALITV